jgi:hypothetical protein
LSRHLLLADKNTKVQLGNILKIVRVFHTQKLDGILDKIELSDWRQRLREPLTVSEHTLSNNWKSCALGERMKKEGRDLDRVKDLTPEAVKLGFDFATAVKRRDSSTALEILEQIERLPTIWRNQQDFQ